tara:strand:- start:103 stop:663 length:561 start_codon:yes stop_codon:yes gene_type:complete
MFGYRNFILSLFVAGAAFMVNTSAQARPPGGMEIDQRMLERAADELGLSDDVLKKVQDASYKAEVDSIDIRSKLERAHLEFKKLMSSDNPNKQEVLKLIEDTGHLEVQMKKNRVGLLLSVRALLSKEQRQKLKKMMRKKRKQQRGERREERRRSRQEGGSMDFDTSEHRSDQESSHGGRKNRQRRR